MSLNWIYRDEKKMWLPLAMYMMIVQKKLVKLKLVKMQITYIYVFKKKKKKKNLSYISTILL